MPRLDEAEPRTGMEAAILAVFRRRTRREQVAVLHALRRVNAGVPVHEAFHAMHRDLGYSEGDARAAVEAGFADRSDWRQVLI